MKEIDINILKKINYFSIAITVALTILFYVELLRNSTEMNYNYFFLRIPNLITQPLLVIFSLIISLKTHQQKGVMLFALFLSLISQDYILQFLMMLNINKIPIIIILISYSLTGTVYIKALQSFPRQVTKQDVNSIFSKNKIISAYINWSIRSYTWFVFPIIIFVAALLKISSPLIDIYILLTAILSLFVNYRKSTSSEKNKILWLFWGLITFTFLMIFLTIININPIENQQNLRFIFNALMSFVVVVSLSMSLFFSNAFDTGVIIKRTIVNGFIFILIVLFYNTIEHYFLHWLSYELGLSDVLLSSLLSGIFVLVFSPVHHHLMNFLTKKIKKNPIDVQTSKN